MTVVVRNLPTVDMFSFREYNKRMTCVLGRGLSFQSLKAYVIAP